ncbi:MAG TPA: thiamine pyrophosphate-dependent enzyme [Marinagarivorans sp.]
MNYTVACYLKERLEQLGLEQLFGVAGNYTAPFLDTILEDEKSPIKISGNPNEICAGYAADAYARIKGIGALYVTYSVGAFSLLNTIAGSYTEQVPVVLINGAPTNKENSVEHNAGVIYSHTTGYQSVDIHMFRPITAAAERITNAEQAIYQIDSALTALIAQKRPVYFEVAEDVWRTPCPKPSAPLNTCAAKSLTVGEEQQAAEATWATLHKRGRFIFWAGVELQRYGLEQDFLELLDAVNACRADDQKIGFVTSALSKSVVSEKHPQFKGCVTLTEDEIHSLVGEDGVIIGIGAWTIGKDTGNQNIRSEGTVLAAQNGVLVGAKYFPSVSLLAYMQALKSGFNAMAQADNQTRLRPLTVARPTLKAASTKQAELGYDSFFHQLNSWLNKDDILVADAGFPLIGAQAVEIAEPGGFIAQASWLAIGYSVAAATGVGCARPDKRSIVVVGDGSFHETCQAVSDHTAYGQNTVVFILANGIYGIEQYLVNPNPFRQPPTDYPSRLQNHVYSYNELPKWEFVKLAEAFGSEGRKVATLNELAAVMDEIRDTPQRNFVVEVTIPKTNVPLAIAEQAAATVGEDETDNPNWPPASKF